MIKSITEITKTFIEFLKNPIEQQEPIQTIKQKTKTFFTLLLIDILIGSVIVGICAIIEEFGLNISGNDINQKMLENESIWYVLLFIVIVGPLFEELIFRLPLRFKFNYLAQSIILFSSIAGKEKKTKVKIYLQNFWTTHFKWIFYSVSLIFGLIHLTNYEELSITIILFAPLLICSQFIGGLTMGYIRVKYNFILALLLHLTFNLIIIGAALTTMDFTANKIDIENVNYAIKINKSSMFDKTNQEYSFYDGKYCNIDVTKISLKTIINKILEKDEHFTETNDIKAIETKINLSFANHTKGVFDSEDIILQHLSDLFNFEYEILDKQQQIWDLHIEDTLKLMKYKSKTPVTKSSTMIFPDKIEFENVDLSIIADAFTTEYNELVVCSNNPKYRFDFSISTSNKDFNSLIHLLKQYGLSLKKRKINCEYVYVNFK